MPKDGIILTPEIAPVFEPMLVPSRDKAAYGGRGSMKSHFFAQAGVMNAAGRSLKKGLRMVCIREVQKTLRESAKRLIEDKIEAFNLNSKFGIRNDEIRTPGGGVILFQGMQDHTAESIKSLEGFDVAWVEEAQTLSNRSLELLRPTIRGEDSERWFSWNPRNPSDPVDLYFRGPEPPDDSIIIRVNWRDNPWFPKVLEQDRLHDLKTNRDRYAHIWDGEYEPQAIGAIWTRQLIHQTRVEKVNRMDLERIVVGIDPAVTNNPHSDYHGVVVCALGKDGHGYVLEDGSLQGSPRDWAVRAITMYDKWEADQVVIEVNQGGDMCRHTLQSIRQSLPIKEVRATRGKHVRAEPISALYDVAQIHHVGTFTDMEDQMCLFTSSGWEGDSESSPDRTEAMIWCMTELFTEITASRYKEPTVMGPKVEGAWMG